eukprot:Skav205439  [mRNA]  locus=scaffold2500:286411:287613:+ [translate_table: standard]
MLPGGDLYRRLQGRDDSKPYHWQDRLRTATEVCRGLAHLHKHRPKIFHRDIKSQNILFSSDGTAKIADFGLACMANHHHEHEIATVKVAGTLGYSDPLYTRTGVISESSECYSFGQVMIELLVGRPPAVLAKDGLSCVFLSDELRPKEERAKGRVLSRLDRRAGWPLQTAASMATLALLCIHDDADRRPSFLEAADMLRDLALTGGSPASRDRSRDGDMSTGASGACSPPIPKWLELRSADVLQKLLLEAQNNQFSKHLQIDHAHLPSPRTHHLQAQSPHVAESPHARNQVLSPEMARAHASQAHFEASHGHQPRHLKHLQLWPPEQPAQRGTQSQQGQQGCQVPQPLRPRNQKVESILEPQLKHAKSMPEASQEAVKELMEHLQRPASSIASADAAARC